MDNNKEDRRVRKRKKRGGKKTRENREKHFRIHGRFGRGRGRGNGGRFNTGRGRTVVRSQDVRGRFGGRGRGINAGKPHSNIDPVPINAGKPHSNIDPVPINAGKPHSNIDPAPINAGKLHSTIDPAPINAGKPHSNIDPVPINAGKPHSTIDPAPINAGKPHSTIDPAPINAGKPHSTIDPAPINAGKPHSTIDPAPINAATTPFDYLSDDFMDFLDDDVSNILDTDIAHGMNLVDTFDSIGDLEDIVPVYEPKQHVFGKHTNLHDLIEELVQVGEEDLHAPQSIIILKQISHVAYKRGPPTKQVLGIYAFDRPPSVAQLAIYMAMFQDCYHFSIRRCDLQILRSHIRKHKPHVEYCFNENGNPFYHFDNSPAVPFDGIVEEGINLFQDLYKSKAMKSAGKRGPTPIVSLGLTTTPASQMREGRITMLLPNTKPITNNNSGLIAHLGIPIFKIMLKSLVIHRSNYKPVRDGIHYSKPSEIPLVYTNAYRKALLIDHSSPFEVPLVYS